MSVGVQYVCLTQTRHLREVSESGVEKIYLKTQYFNYLIFLIK